MTDSDAAWIDEMPEAVATAAPTSKTQRIIAAGLGALFGVGCLGLIAFLWMGPAFRPRLTPTVTATHTLTPTVTPTATRVPLRFLGPNGAMQTQQPAATLVAAPALTASPTPTLTPTRCAIIVPTLAGPLSASTNLSVPSLSINVGVTRTRIVKSVWDVEALTTLAGLLDSTGRKPGDALAMAIAGHVTLKDGSPGPFFKLAHLKPGDTVIYRDSGTEYTYTVTTIETVPASDTVKLYVENGAALLLTTCADWDVSIRAYRNRLVVTAMLTSQRKV